MKGMGKRETPWATSVLFRCFPVRLSPSFSHAFYLYDEKRKKVNVGDLIEFTNITTDEKLITKVTSIYTYKDFDELYENHNKVSIGYDEIKENGVVGIEVKLYNK